jgi:DNA-directed RNA polymerase subunit M/transcription elongation factor TFIIS
LKQQKPWFDEECSQYLGQRKQAKMHCLQDPNCSNTDNLNNIRHEASKHMRNKKKNYLKAEIDELETNSNIKNIKILCRTIIDFKKAYQPKTNIVKDEKVDLFRDSHHILAKWKNHFFVLLNVHGVEDDSQTEIHTAEPQVLLRWLLKTF